MRAKAAPPNPDPPGTPMSPFVCVLYRHWLTYYCNLRGDFKVKLTKWKIRNRASYTEVAAEFGYVGILQIQQWEKIYRKKWVEWVIVYRKRT